MDDLFVRDVRSGPSIWERGFETEVTGDPRTAQTKAEGAALDALRRSEGWKVLRKRLEVAEGLANKALDLAPFDRRESSLGRLLGQRKIIRWVIDLVEGTLRET